MPPARRIAFATWSGDPELNPDDLLAAEVLRRRGHEVVAWPWDGPPPPGRVDAVVLRTTWNYHLAPEVFAAWLSALRESGMPVFNPVDLVLWNAHKRYLLELEGAGVAIPPTILVPRGPAPDLAALLRERRWTAAVVKPAVSANAHRTLSTTAEAAAGDQDTFAALAAAGDVLVQAFVPEVRAEGELSLVFIDGALSHAVRKRPGAGEFRVQEHYGGTVGPAAVGPSLVAECRRVLDRLGARPLYARVDGVLSARGFLLMEVELIEPTLFLSFAAAAPFRLADALVRRLAG